MKVYVLTLEPYHENSSVVGVYLTAELAMAAMPGEWAESPPGWVGDWRLSETEEEDAHLIHELDLVGHNEPIEQFALSGTYRN